MLGKMIDEGMNVARMNFSHGSHDYHGEVADNVRAAVKVDPKRHCAVLLDTKGPEIRTGKVKEGKVDLVAGQHINVSVDNTILGDSQMISLDYKNLITSVKPGFSILIADGLISLTVESLHPNEGYVSCRVNNTATLGDTKNVHLPGAVVDLPAVSEKDIEDLKFGVKKNVDMVAASFIRKADDVRQIREIIGKRIKIISKIESIEGIENFDEILIESDGIMVARGDLGVELPMEQIFIAQKMMIGKCNAAGKPVVTATQMLESMITSPKPTRAECTDVANAVLDGTDCVMLSGETASGSYPLEAIRIMRKVCQEAERVEMASDYPSMIAALIKSTTKITDAEIAAAYSVRTANDLKASLIITITDSGRSSRLVCKYRPKVPVICVTSDENTANNLLTTRAALPLLADNADTKELVAKAVEKAKKFGYVQAGNKAVLITGTEGRDTITVRVLTIS